ncbi:tRNA uridine-5-carboxymethylaminomethyl(34) synthesis GTPase MnmE [uncultured Desulfobacter sp.]|uniref:tRNA uridine-5-carboxymethylaminomethyl(34) synthesis GTPase MnmE n=1 Tax=uncultured Desulfobacter sp. TaxID=240139 RepID=UPI002AAB4DD3|nr:tRNA uridine-5-carboxymethylaminomethyl(34) synthesis GTPase MnmE [uncultured Desulfobacter sp.]
MTDTIAAIATPFGSGGIGVIRISGPSSFDLAAKIFSKTPADGGKKVPQFVSHRVSHGFICDGDTTIDEVLVIPMKAPHSYTAEDVVEIQAHSGTIVLRRILDLLFSHGVRPAEPGEFTRRAFLNGRIDLTQAEAVADIINARSDASLKFAASQNVGVLRQSIQEMVSILTGFLARLEAAIDFPDEAGAFFYTSQDKTALQSVADKIGDLIRQHKDACFLKTGIRLTICGEPNVGKSSIMNRILEKEKSIITDIPGTTRDPIEDSLTIEGIPFVIVDTAGIHQTDDLVEIIGIEKAKDQIEAADIVLYVLEPGKPFPEKTASKTLPRDKPVIFAINKMDLADGLDLPHFPEQYAGSCSLEISALTGHGINGLRTKLLETCIGNLEIGNDAVIPNLRHKNALVHALEHMTAMMEGLDKGQEEETLALDAKNCIDQLGTITGDTASLDILDAVFNNFCIGK